MNALDSPERDRAAQRRNAAQVSVVCLRVVRERFHVCHRIHTGYPCRTAVPSPLYLRSRASRGPTGGFTVTGSLRPVRGNYSVPVRRRYIHIKDTSVRHACRSRRV